MTFDEAKHALRMIVDGATDEPIVDVPVATLKDILEGFDNDEQVKVMHNTAVALLLRLGGQAELRPKDALELHHTHSIKLTPMLDGKMLLKVINKAEQN